VVERFYARVYTHTGKEEIAVFNGSLTLPRGISHARPDGDFKGSKANESKKPVF
jgi:hypothetical protein